MTDKDKKVLWLFDYLTLTVYLIKVGKKLMSKMRMKMRQFGRMNLVFEFSISKLGYVAIFMKIWEKKNDPLFKTFLTNRGKNQDENETKLGNWYKIFKLPISKLGNMARTYLSNKLILKSLQNGVANFNYLLKLNGVFVIKCNNKFWTERRGRGKKDFLYHYFKFCF